MNSPYPLGRIANCDIEVFQKELSKAREVGFNAARLEAPKPVNPSGWMYQRYVFETFEDFEKTLNEDQK